MSDPEKDKLLQTVQAARRVALKKTLEKVRNEESSTSQEHRTLKEYEEDLLAEIHRVVTRGSLEGTRFRRTTTPYLEGIMDAAWFPRSRP